MFIVLNKMILMRSFLTRVLYDCFKVIYAYLNHGDNVRECYSCLEMMMQAYLHVGFFTMFFIKRASLKRFYLYMKLLKQIIFARNFLQLPIQKI